MHHIPFFRERQKTLSKIEHHKTGMRHSSTIRQRYHIRIHYSYMNIYSHLWLVMMIKLDPSPMKSDSVPGFPRPVPSRPAPRDGWGHPKVD